MQIFMNERETLIIHRDEKTECDEESHTMKKRIVRAAKPSLAAKGLLAYLFSINGNDNFSVSSFPDLGFKDLTRPMLGSLILELKEHGYLYERFEDASGIKRSIFTLFETPLSTEELKKCAQRRADDSFIVSYSEDEVC